MPVRVMVVRCDAVLAVGAEDLASSDAGYDPHGMNPVAVLAGLPGLGGPSRRRTWLGLSRWSSAKELGCPNRCVAQCRSPLRPYENCWPSDHGRLEALIIGRGERKG